MINHHNSIFLSISVWKVISNWSVCSSTCGGGTKSRDRECRNETHALTDDQCEGNAQQTTSCNNEPCGGKP